VINYSCSIIFALSIAVAGCATAPPPPVWVKVDGTNPSPQQFEIDSKVCRGESQKANASGTMPSTLIGAAIRKDALEDVYSGCMAQKGYLLRAAPQH
jgi:hypothetical protein